jgi:hypothetical protein
MPIPRLQNAALRESALSGVVFVLELGDPKTSIVKTSIVKTSIVKTIIGQVAGTNRGNRPD